MSEVVQDWRDKKLGARIRAALWLRDEVGEGGTFSKQDLRAAVQGKEQVDRRMRDLRPAGWVIKNYRDKPSLQPDELYLEKIGLPIWEKEHRAAGLRQISAKTRRFVYERDGHMCRRCGVGAAEAYPDDPDSHARLTLGHVNSHKSGSAANAEDLITECARCNETVRHLTGVQMGREQVWDRVKELSRKDKLALHAWMAGDVRPITPVEQAWGMYRQLPAALRDEVAGDLRALLQG
ncbi:HNH endonuclease [Streptomyces sp. RKAG337]|uniref:HNH endonuclease n=1 Tax=Streptomyces sp. RKAG337 TaxID=2893404 RepID=UPI002033BBFF|nr:HNH endonuclease [Streptomyces sp. RKAG337]MCM2427679.1 HNH endonuclease [Streptomyces sp. RKAG337]